METWQLKDRGSMLMMVCGQWKSFGIMWPWHLYWQFVDPWSVLGDLLLWCLHLLSVICLHLPFDKYRSVSDGRDHTACCKNLAVPELCLSYCQGQLSPTTGVGALCLNYIPRYVQCFVNGSSKLLSLKHFIMIVIDLSTCRWLSETWRLA